MLTPEEVERLRSEFVANADKKTASTRKKLDAVLEDIAMFLLANRGHVGGIQILVTPLPGHAMVDPVNEIACDVLARLECVDAASRTLMHGLSTSFSEID